MDNPAENAQDTAIDDLLLADSPEDDDPLLEEPAAARQGLPPGFRMRHDRHYVDELLGVRVAPAVRPVPHVTEPPAAAPQARETNDDTVRSLRAALAAVAERLDGIRAHAVANRRSGSVTAFDRAAQLEIDRTARLAHAAIAIGGDLQLVRRDCTAAQIAERARQAIAPLRTFGSTRFDISVEDAGLRISVDASAVTQAIAGTLHAFADLGDRSRDADELPLIRIKIHIVEPRPALMVDISAAGLAVSDDAIATLFDAAAACHAAGAEGALLLSGAARIARAHGGRADARRNGDAVVALLVFPR